MLGTLATTVAFILLTTHEPDGWPQWCGPGRDGIGSTPLCSTATFSAIGSRDEWRQRLDAFSHSTNTVTAVTMPSVISNESRSFPG